MDRFQQTITECPELAWVFGLGAPPARNSGPGTARAEGCSGPATAETPEHEQVPGPVQDSETGAEA